MKRRQIQSLALALVTLLLMTACAPAAETGVEADLSALTGADCGGRLAGTAGNQAAADYIAGQFQAHRPQLLHRSSAWKGLVSRANRLNPAFTTPDLIQAMGPSLTR